jgi:Tfp pilus assembly protein FimT
MRINQKSKIKNQKNSGFTLVELLIILGILIITTTAVPAYRNFQKESDLINSAEEIINILRVAQSKTLASEQDSQWGVYFSTTTAPNQYTLFKGVDYVSRDISFDQNYTLSSSVEIYEIILTESSSETVFNKLTGTTNNYGSISSRLITDYSKTKTIIVESSGQIFYSQAIASDENRIKDSRHVHFDYNRQINTLTETLILTFTYNSSDVIENIAITSNMQDSQIYWEGEVSVDGQIQKLKIHTHRLNDPILGTQFCVHRDKRYNDKALKIELDADLSGNLINYDNTGQTTQGTSIYVSTPIWQ